MDKCRYIFILFIVSGIVWAQDPKSERHVRSMLRQSVYNTGELGRSWDRGTLGIEDGQSSLEWPPNSSMTIDGKGYKGQHNSFGGGLYIDGYKNGVRQTIACGAIAKRADGSRLPISGVYVVPGSITRTENYPFLSNGSVNSNYNPNEAEEIITAEWKTIQLDITVQRTSRAWGIPGYNSFIIYEYDIVSNEDTTITDAFIGWGYALAPSMFGFERMAPYQWYETVVRTTIKEQYPRFDFSRWMVYNHDRTGKPENDPIFFNQWADKGNRGGLNSPQAVGILPLHIDTTHLSKRGSTRYKPTASDSNLYWDSHNHLKQPWIIRYDNANNDITKVMEWTDAVTRKHAPFSRTDSTSLASIFPSSGVAGYWGGRGKPSWTIGYNNPVTKAYIFGPYTLTKGEHIRFALAEVVGYGPGVASDSIYQDSGGGLGSGEDGTSIGVHPVPSWYKKFNQNKYTSMVGDGIGSDYLQTHELPWYVTPEAVSIRDVADRAIQMYTGTPLTKWDGLQFDPQSTPSTGAYNSVSIPIPSPIITIENTGAAVNRITWKPLVETFTVQRLRAPFSHYEAYRSLSGLGPWTKIDSIGKQDPRYLRDSMYVLYDRESNIGEDVYYVVYSVDVQGNKSGATNLIGHTTQSPTSQTLGKVYVVPNPLIVTNGITDGSSNNGEFTDRIGFYGLTKKCTIRIFSYSGQLVRTLEHDTPAESGFSQEWFQLSRNNQMIASGIYFFTVDDAATGKRSTGKFVIIH